MYYYKFLNVVYEKIAYKDATFVNENLWINKKSLFIYLLKLFS
jgi:hypothetical protein